MARLLGTYRLIPIVLLAIGALFLLKSTGIVFDGGYTLGERMALREAQTMTVTVPVSPSTPLRSPSTRLDLASAEPRRSWMQEMFNYPDAAGGAAARRSAASTTASRAAAEAAADPVVTGSITQAAAKVQPQAAPGAKPDAKPAAGAETEARIGPAAKGGPAPAGSGTADAPAPEGRVIPLLPPGAPSASERALLERLQERRQELEARNRELDLREAMIKAAEKKLEAQLAAIKATEARIAATVQQRDDEEAKRFRGIITMYETMKPREAAKIFDRLDSRVLLEVAGQMNPRRMSDIMAQMTPAAAEKLTVDLASRAAALDRAQNPADLPKIQGRPTGG